MGKPELRFPEFTEEWEEVILNDVMKRVSKPVDVEKETLYRQIGIRSHGKGLFYKENVTGKELGNKRVFWIEPDCLVLNIVFAWERAVARTTKDEVGMIASHRFPMYKTADDRLDLDYAVQYLTTKRGSNILILASPGGAGRNKTLGQEAFLKSRMLLPNIAEQKRIVELLKAVNDVIAVEQKQVSLWEEKKKCAMQKIFSQEIRFKADDGSDYPEWEEESLNNIADIYDGTHQTPQYVESGIKFVSVENIRDLYGTEKYITKDSYDKEFKIRPNRGDILMTRIGDIGTPAYISSDEELAYYVSLALIKCKKISGEYLFHYIESRNFKNELWKRTLHTAYPEKINKGDIGVCKVMYPCIEEQKKIARCLFSLDNVINIKRKKVEVWVIIIDGLLQQMFI